MTDPTDPTQPTVRLATPADLPLLLAADDLFDDLPDPAGLQTFFDSPDHLLILAFIGPDLAAFATLHLLPRPHSPRREAFLYEIGTRDQFLRQGAARAILQFTENLCKTQNHDGPWVITNKSNHPATQLYQSVNWISKTQDDIVYERS